MYLMRLYIHPHFSQTLSESFVWNGTVDTIFGIDLA
jgi:hypothetical protein